MTNEWHTLTKGEIEKKLNTDLSDGLSVREARERLEEEKKRSNGDRYSLFVPKSPNYIKSIFALFATPCVLIAVVVSALAALLGGSAVGILVFLITFVGAIACGIILCNAEKRSHDLYNCASPLVKVQRGGQTLHTDGRNAVKGDILILSVGDVLPCDVRLIDSRALVVKELIPTKKGIRNRIVFKDHTAIYDIDSGISAPDAANMLYAGSAVVEGEARAIVVATSKEVYLAGHCPEGALSSNSDGCGGFEEIKPPLYRIFFFAVCAVAVLTLLSLVIFGSKHLLSSFLMLITTVCMVTFETYKIGYKSIFSLVAERMSRAENKNRDAVVKVRDGKTLETLSGLTDLVLLGSAAFTDGLYHASNTYISGRILPALTSETEEGKRLMRYIYTYLRGLREGDVNTSLALDGISDALNAHLKHNGFDKMGADLVLRSLYFVKDSTGNNGYVCVETTEGEYRVILTYDIAALSQCKLQRMSDGSSAELDASARREIAELYKRSEAAGGRCLYVITETDGEALLEGVLSLCEGNEQGLSDNISELAEMGIKTTAMLSYEDAEHITPTRLSAIFGDSILYASDLKKANRELSECVGKYSAYIGFEPCEYASMIELMRKDGTVAAYGIDNDYYDAMSRANISVSCDILKFSTQKHAEAVYDSLPQEGRDTNIRCSQLTRLLSKVIVHRCNRRGGGVVAIENAIKRSRAAYISFSHSVLFFAYILTMLLPLTFMSVVTGVELLNAVQAASISVLGAILSITVFSDSVSKRELIMQKLDREHHTITLLMENMIPLIMRLSLNLAFALIVTVLEACKVFGESASYSMAAFISVILVTAAELFVINGEFTRRGIGRRRTWVSFLVLYLVILSVCALMTLGIFSRELFPNGIGTYEFILTPIYCIIYIAVIFIAKYVKVLRKA